MGTWVEIAIRADRRHALKSSPAWGRGLKSIGRCILEMSVRVVPRMGTWVEMQLLDRFPLVSSSSPAWGRGLKYVGFGGQHVRDLSSPAWGRGLKSSGVDQRCLNVWSSPAWGRGLKCTAPWAERSAVRVVPRMGTWVEIAANLTCDSPLASSPAWGRGLKCPNVRPTEGGRCRPPHGDVG